MSVHGSGGMLSPDNSALDAGGSAEPTVVDMRLRIRRLNPPPFSPRSSLP
jgi:hypothetical protein